MSKLNFHNLFLLLLIFFVSFNSNLQAQSRKKLLKLANEQINNHDWNEAIAYFDKYLKKDPSNLDVHYKRGMCLIESKQFEKAILDFELLEQNNYTADDVNYYLAVAHSLINHLEIGEKYINKQIEVNDFLKCHYIKASILLSMGNYHSAIEEFNYFISKETTLSNAYAFRGLCYTFIGESALAYKDLNQSLSMEITAENQFAKGCFLYISELNYSEALKYFQKAIRLDFPDVRARVFERACLVHLDKPFESNESFGNLDSLINTNPKFSAMVGHAYLMKRKYQMADSYFSNAIRLNYEVPEVYILKALCEMELDPENCDAFMYSIEKSWELDPGEIMTLSLMMDALLKCNKQELAFERMNEAYKNPLLDTFQLDILKLNVLSNFEEEKWVSEFTTEELLPKYKNDIEKLNVLLDTLVALNSFSASLEVADRMIEINGQDIEVRNQRLKAIAYAAVLSKYEVLTTDFEYVMSVDSLNEKAWYYRTLYFVQLSPPDMIKNQVKLMYEKFPMNLKFKYMYLIVLYNDKDSEFCVLREKCLDLNMNLDEELLDYTCN